MDAKEIKNIGCICTKLCKPPGSQAIIKAQERRPVVPLNQPMILSSLQTIPDLIIS